MTPAPSRYTPSCTTSVQMVARTPPSSEKSTIAPASATMHHHSGTPATMATMSAAAWRRMPSARFRYTMKIAAAAPPTRRPNRRRSNS